MLDVSVVQTQHLSIHRVILLQLPVVYKIEKFLLCSLVSSSSCTAPQMSQPKHFRSPAVNSKKKQLDQQTPSQKTQQILKAELG